MSGLCFATCDRRRALVFLQQARGDETLTDTPESMGPLLDLVAQDVIRVTDPSYHLATVIGGTNWDESRRDEVMALAEELFPGAHRPVEETDQ